MHRDYNSNTRQQNGCNGLCCVFSRCIFTLHSISMGLLLKISIFQIVPSTIAILRPFLFMGKLISIIKLLCCNGILCLDRYRCAWVYIGQASTVLRTIIVLNIGNHRTECAIALWSDNYPYCVGTAFFVRSACNYNIEICPRYICTMNARYESFPTPRMIRDRTNEALSKATRHFY